VGIVLAIGEQTLASKEASYNFVAAGRSETTAAQKMSTEPA
jgi:hypothetical protein